MAILPDRPEHGRTYTLDPDDGTRVEFLPYNACDSLAWKVTPSGADDWEWWTDADVEDLPGGALVPVQATKTAR